MALQAQLIARVGTGELLVSGSARAAHRPGSRVRRARGSASRPRRCRRAGPGRPSRPAVVPLAAIRVGRRSWCPPRSAACAAIWRCARGPAPRRAGSPARGSRPRCRPLLRDRVAHEEHGERRCLVRARRARRRERDAEDHERVQGPDQNTVVMSPSREGGSPSRWRPSSESELRVDHGQIIRARPSGTARAALARMSRIVRSAERSDGGAVEEEREVLPEQPRTGEVSQWGRADRPTGRGSSSPRSRPSDRRP